LSGGGDAGGSVQDGVRLLHLIGDRDVFLLEHVALCTEALWVLLVSLLSGRRLVLSVIITVRTDILLWLSDLRCNLLRSLSGFFLLVGVLLWLFV
jgi:hypothetical protein